MTDEERKKHLNAGDDVLKGIGQTRKNELQRIK
jgi:hypothetical protein